MDKGGKNPAFDSGGVAKGDAKDSDDFEYLTYDACPTWNADASDKLYHKSSWPRRARWSSSRS